MYPANAQAKLPFGQSQRAKIDGQLCDLKTRRHSSLFPKQLYLSVGSAYGELLRYFLDELDQEAPVTALALWWGVLHHTLRVVDHKHQIQGLGTARCGKRKKYVMAPARRHTAGRESAIVNLIED